MEDSTRGDTGEDSREEEGFGSDAERAARMRLRAAAGATLLVLTLAAGWAAGRVDPLPPTDSPTASLAFAAPAVGGIHFTGRLDRGSVLQDGDGVVRLELVLSADAIPGSDAIRVPTDLVVVLDRSGSMEGKPLADAIASVRELVTGLGHDDRFALVTYASDVQLAIPLQNATPANRSHWDATLRRIGAVGGTNMAIGIDLATDTVARHRQPGRVVRVILLSDGHANQGDHSIEGLRARAARATRAEYVLSTVGVGLDFDEQLMAALADAGTGNFYYVKDGRDLGDVFSGEFAAARETVASAVAVELVLGPEVALLDAAGYPIERVGSVTRFRPGTLFAGQERRIWLTLRAPTGALGELSLGEFRLAFREQDGAGVGPPRSLRFRNDPRIACVAEEAEFVASLEKDLVLHQIGVDGLAKLKQRVALAVGRGRRDEAQQAIDAFTTSNGTTYELLGIDQREAPSYFGARTLQDKVEAAFTRASPGVARAAQHSLSKTLAEEGVDEQRSGAKR